MNERRKPPMPPPLEEGLSWFRRFFRTRKSWLDNIRARSYGMKMGESRAPWSTTYMPNEPGLIRRVLIEERESFPKDRRYWSLIEPLTGRSLLNSDGEEWKRQRRMIDPAFGQARLKVVFPLMRDAVGDMIGRFDAAVEGDGTFEADSAMSHITADVILRALLSLPLSTEDSRNLFTALKTFTASLPVGTNLALGRLPGWIGWFFGAHRRKPAARRFRALLEERVRPRFDAHRAGGSGERKDILAGLLEARDEVDGKAFDFSEIVDHVATLFLAGHETSASSLAWAMYLIAITPEVQERMASEIAAETGGREIEFADLKRLRLTFDVYRETIRLYPPGGVLPREAAATATMRGKTISPGSPVLVSPWLMHRNPNFWQRPNEFDPDRFRVETEAVANAYLPFGQGPRACIGQAFALQEAVLVLASLVKRYRFAPVEGCHPMPVGHFTIRSAKPILIAVTRRG